MLEVLQTILFRYFCVKSR